MSGEVPGQAGNNHPSLSSTGTFTTKDGYVNIAALPSMWDRLCDAMQREDLRKHPDFATPALRVANTVAIRHLIQSYATELDTATIVERLNRAGVPCGPIYTMEETFADPQVRHLEIVQSVRSKALGMIKLIGQPFRLAKVRPALKIAAPESGEHTDEVLVEIGYDAGQIKAFRHAGIV